MFLLSVSPPASSKIYQVTLSVFYSILHWERSDPGWGCGLGEVEGKERGKALPGPFKWDSCSDPGDGRGLDRAAGADKAAWACPSLFSGVPGEEKQPVPTPDLVEAEVGSTAILKCGPSPASGNFSQVDWFLVSAWTLEGSSCVGSSCLSGR